MKNFDFAPAPFVPFQDRDVLLRLRPMGAEELSKHPNPNFRLHVGLNLGSVMLMDLFARL